MLDHVMDADSAVELLTVFGDGGVDVRLSGGWAVDALLGAQTRVHSDLDLWLEATQFEDVIVVLAQVGMGRPYPWRNDRPWNFVVHDGAHRRVDLRAYERLRDESSDMAASRLARRFRRMLSMAGSHQRRRRSLRSCGVDASVAHRPSGTSDRRPRRRPAVREVRARTSRGFRLASSSAAEAIGVYMPVICVCGDAADR